MSARLKVGISLSPDAITVAFGEVRKSAQVLQAMLRLPLPPGGIDPISGRVVCQEALLAVLEKVYLSDRLNPKYTAISIAIPSSATYVRTWTEAGQPKPLSQGEVRQRVDRIFPGKSEGLMFDLHQHVVASQGHTQFMLVVVNREVLESYIRLLGSRVALLERVTTTEIARYATCCAINSTISNKPSLVVRANGEYFQATIWKEGVICDSRSTLLSGDLRSGEYQRRAHVGALTSLLAEALAHCNERERAVCKVVVCYGAADGLVEESVRALGYGSMDLEHIIEPRCFEARNDRLQHMLQAYTGEITHGVEDALGLVILGTRQ
jgi:hypothetical protein